LGRRSRKRAGRPAAAPQPVRRRRPTSEQRDSAVRAELEPLAPGERPPAVTVAAIVALVLAAGNVVFLVAGIELRGQKTSPGGALLFVALMLAAAAGLWRARYWAVLGFEALLGLTLATAAISLLFVGTLAGVLICVATLGGAGWLFWKLIRAMARIQMPERPSAHG
jgi:hypothetical protein